MNCLKNITSADVIAAIRAARVKVVFLAPGITPDVSTALSVAWQSLGPEAVTVILDVDPEVVRLGYGTLEGLESIQQAAAKLGQAVCHQPGVRICVVVADDQSLIFTPTPLLVEAGSTQPSRPNGVALQNTPKTLGDELGIGDEGQARRAIGLKVVPTQDVEAVKKDLKDNPPLKFDISRKERVFNARLEFVEFELEGCFISRHTVTIPPDLLRITRMDKETRAKLRSSFRLVEESDIIDAKNKMSEKTLRDERQRIAKKFLVPIKGYGTVMLRANKEAFEKEVDGLRTKVSAFSVALREKLADIYEANAKRLTKALLPAVAKKPPENWTRVLGTNPDRAAIEQHLRQTLLDSFGNPEDLLGAMQVNLVFKGITYGTLTAPEFVKLASAAFPQIKIHEEYDAARGMATSAPTAAPRPSA
jgi:hypothetical protein